jgi:hypothetical protein
MDDILRGTIKISWSIPYSDAQVPPDDPLTQEQIVTVCDRVAEAVCEGLPQDVELYLDGEDKLPVRLSYEVDSSELEIEEAPEQLVGMVDDVRSGHQRYDGDSELDDD